MTSMELLEALGGIQDSYIAQAHRPERRRLPRWAILIAAVLAALLTGCAVVYALRSANLKVGSRSYSEPVYDESMALQGYTTGSREVLTLSGLKGTAGYRAAREWYDFLADYDPDYAIYHAARAAGTTADFPEKYAAFSPYSAEMTEKIGQIAEEYDLSLPGAALSFPSEKAGLQAMGIESLLVPGSSAEEKCLAGSFYENGNFRLTFLLWQEDAPWPYQTLCTLAYTRSDSFSPWFAELDEGITWREWNYTTPSGAEILLLRSQGSSTAWLFRQGSDGFLAATVEVTQDLYDDENGVSQRSMTDAELEQLADQIDWSIAPTPAAGAADTGADASARVQAVGGYTLELCSAATDGTTAYITLHLTAPEGTSLQDSEHHSFLRFGTVSFSGGDGEEPDYTYSSVMEDDTGSSATIAVIAEAEDRGFAGDAAWALYLENLEATYFEAGVGVKTLWSSEGVWQFALDFSASDTREVELLSSPVTVSAASGMDSGGTYIYEDCALTSFTLRSYSATTRFSGRGGEIAPSADRALYVVLKDGTRMALTNASGGSGTYCLRLEDMTSPIPLDEVSYILLPDGQRLDMP